MKTKVAIFASGAGSNAQNLINYFENDENVKICLLATNNHQSGVVSMSQKYAIPLLLFDKSTFYNEEFLINLKQVDLIILAGFLWLMPKFIIKSFEDKIINIHPSLLPKYGGKGMYGSHVHKAVLENKEAFSGITIHLVNEEYDKGKILFQSKIKIDNNETIQSLQEKIHSLEYNYFPTVVKNFLTNHESICF